MSIYHITRIVQEQYRIEADSQDEAVRKLNRATPDSAITKRLTIREIPDANGGRAEAPKWAPQGPGPWGE